MTLLLLLRHFIVPQPIYTSGDSHNVLDPTGAAKHAEAS